MRVTVIDEENLQAFQRLLGSNTGSSSVLEELKSLNPHVDFSRIVPGTVLLIPDALGFHDAESFSVTGDVFAALREQMLASVDEAGTRLRGGYENLLAEHKEVAAVLKSAVVKRAIEADADLKPQIEAAAQIFKHDQQQAKDADKTMQTLREQAEAELALLTKLLG